MDEENNMGENQPITTPEPPVAQEQTESTGGVQDQINAIVQKIIPGSDPTPENQLKALQMLDNLHEKFMVAVENDPDFGAALSDILKGETARIALARAYGPDAFTAVEGDPDYEAMGNAYNSAKERIAKKKEMAGTIAKNQEMSVNEITTWMEEKGYDDAGIQARLKKMDEIRQDFLNDKITKQHLELIDKAMDFDQAVANAEQAGKVAGRNEKIVEGREKMKVLGDGLPALTSRNPKKQPPQSYGDKFLKGVI